MIDITRRGFVAGAAGAMGALGAMGATGVSLGMPQAALAHDETRGADCPWSGPGSVAGDWTGTPEDIKAIGGCTMPLEELNARRKMYVDAQTEYTKADGTVVPAVYVKLHALLNTYSFGVGNEINDDCCNWFMAELSEDEAQAMLDMPYGRQFSAYEFAALTDRTVEEAEELLHTLSVEKAWLNRVVNDRGNLYCQVPCVQGFFEYHDPDWFRGDVVDLATAGKVYSGDYIQQGYRDAGSPFFGPVPVSRDVVKDGAIYPFDDVVEIWKTKEKFSLSPCTCRLTQHNDDKDSLPGFPDGDFDLTDVFSPCGHRLETCLCCG